MEDSKLLERIDRNVEKLDNKVESLDARIGSLQMEMAVQINILEEHQRRSLANEAILEELRKENEPIKAHIAMFSGVAKAIGIAGGVVGLVATLLKFLGKF